MNNSQFQHRLVVLVAVATGLALSSCAKKTSEVAFSSSSISYSGASARVIGEGAFAQNLTEFKVCVKKVKLEGEDGVAVKTDDTSHRDDSEEDYIKFTPGLINIAEGVQVNWGTMEIPVGFKLKKIKVKVAKDQNLCGVNYSINVNGVTSTEDIEFRWKFEPALDLDSGTKALRVSLGQVVSALRNLSTVDASNIKQAIESVEDSAEKSE